MDKAQFYRVQDRSSQQALLAPSSMTFQQLYDQVAKRCSRNQNFTIYYLWKPLDLPKFSALTLKQIVLEDPSSATPEFYVYDHVDGGDQCPYRQKYGLAVAEHQDTGEDQKEYWVGENGHVLFDSRNTALLASSVKHASKNGEYASIEKEIVNDFSSSIIEPDKKYEEEELSLVSRILTKLNIIKKKPTAKDLASTIEAIKAIDNEEKLKSHINTKYSDYDPNFAAYLEAVYLRFGILSAYKLHYIEWTNIQQGVIPYKIPEHAKVAIIGDFGTGLPDSVNLLRDLILVKGVDIILHLGDVYYAGTPHEYELHVTKPLNELREQAKGKYSKNKQVLFYSIPGNHDYYSWGLPFLAFVMNINEGKLYKQEASYFCLRSADDKWQFVGLDTAFHDSNPVNQINGLSLGPHIRHRQIEWFEDKMENFNGSTVLLTHHQLYSIHDRICGSYSKYRQFSCVNPLLSAQLFKYLPHLSGWYWGHEHAFMMFAEDVMGVRKCRLLGNSSFHVFQKEGPYQRKKGFPFIPLLEDDNEYLKKYLPIDPNCPSESCFNLCYALIDMAKQEPVHEAGIFSSSLPVEYYCAPCYSPEDEKQPHFEPYLLYSETLHPRINSVMVGKNAGNKFALTHNNFEDVTTEHQILLKCEIGLFVDVSDQLNLEGFKFRIRVVESKWKEEEMEAQLRDTIIDGSIIQLEPAHTCIWKAGSPLLHQKLVIRKKRVMKDQFISIRTGDSFTLQNVDTQEYLGCQIQQTVTLKSFPDQSTPIPCLFQFIKDSKVIKAKLH